MGVLKEFCDFVRHRKKFWLMPLLLALALLAAVIILAETAAVVPFIYTLF